MVDLTTTYLGLGLASPLVPSASPLTRSLDAVRRMEDFGAGAVVLHSLFQEQVLRHEGRGPFDPLLLRGPASPAGLAPDGAALRGYLPDDPGYWPDPAAYVEHVRRVKAAVAIPVIASLNGVAPGPWLDWAGALEQAGADALEVGIYFLPADPSLPSAALEQLPVDLVREVRRRVRIPVAAKLSPYYTNLPAVARRVTEAGAAGLVLFSRFYQPDIDPQLGPVDPGGPAPTPRPTLSTPEAPEALRLPLRWIALLYGRVGADLAGAVDPVDLAGTGGVHGAPDALRLLLARASVAMLASELLRHGLGRLAEIRRELEHWLV
jgi:dihydroorotate dehydrogenase (fumarate)